MKYTKENPLRVATLCSGYDSQCLALRRLGIPFDLVAWSEIDKYAIKAHNALFPEYADRNLGDMTKIDWTEVEDFDLLTYSTPCFVAGTLVLTARGYLPIEGVKVGDLVLTHTNTFQKVLNVGHKPYIGNLYHINAMCLHELHCTEEHPFYVRRMYRKGHESIRMFHDPEWIKAKNLDTNCYIGYAINQESKLPEWDGVEDNRWGHHKMVNKLSDMLTNNEFWYLMGRYVGDGWCRNSEFGHSVIIASSARNTDTLKDCINTLGLHYNTIDERTCNKTHIYSKELWAFVKRYGYMAYGKYVDIETLNLPICLLKSFIQGYVDSDGCFSEGLFKVTTVSETLVYGMAQCIAKVYNRPFSIYKNRRKPKTVIEGREVNQRDSFSMTWKTTTDKQDKAFYEDGYIWFPISQFPKFESAEVMVYNLEVENDNSYTANGAIVHNCTDISLAGQQKGLEKGSGTRSSILWYTEHCIDVKRPKFLQMENVAALASQKFAPFLHSWMALLQSYGYTNYTEILNAKDYGVPQNRERVIMISIHETADISNYYFPEPFKLERRLIDVLEKNVDEKYYVDVDVERVLNIIGKEKPDDTILGSLQGHASTQPIQGGVSPTLGTTDFGLPKILRNE